MDHMHIKALLICVLHNVLSNNLLFVCKQQLVQIAKITFINHLKIDQIYFRNLVIEIFAASRLHIFLLMQTQLPNFIFKTYIMTN